MTNAGIAQTITGDLDLFGHSGQAKMYREFRPVYPTQLVEYVASLVSEASRTNYVDVACGSGQLTTRIAPFFEHTVGVDKSFEQLGQADNQAVEWKAGSAFDLCFPVSSIDLLTVAQGLHWLVPYEKFFAEVDRVLKPGGVFAAVAYAFPKLVNPDFNRIVRHFYEDILGALKSPGQEGCLWETNRPTIDGFYQDIPFPPSRKIKHFVESVSLTVDHYTNYLKTLSAYRTLMRRDPSQDDPVNAIKDQLTSMSPNGLVDVEIDFFVVSYTKA